MVKEKAILYKRVSTNEQALEGYSLANQEKEMRDECEKHNIEVVEIYADEGISGSEIEERIGLKSALNHLLYSDEGIKYIMCWKLSRLSRRVIDVLEIVELLEQSGKILVTIKDGINTSRPQDKFLVHFSGIFAEFERDTMIMQVTGGMEQKAREGEWNGGKPPLGYDLVEKSLVINDEQAEIVKRIYNSYLSGKGYLTIARELNEEGYKTSRGNKYSGYGVKFILTNPTYKGWVRWGYRKDWGKKHKNPKTGVKERKRKYNKDAIFVKGIHKPIISEERYNLVQDRIKDNPRHHVKRFQGYHLLSGLLRCPHCGQGMSIQRTESKGKVYHYYICNQYQNKKQCSAVGINQEVIEKEFFDIFEMITTSEDFRKQLTAISVDKDLRVQELQLRIDRIDKNIYKLEKEEKRLLDELVYLTKERQKQLIRDRLDAISDEIEEAEELISKTKRQFALIEEETLDSEEMLTILSNANKVIQTIDSKERKQDLVRMLIKAIRVREKKIVEIDFNYGATLSIDYTGKVLGLEREGGAVS
jgi:site-specific DNA recombinase